MFNTGIYFKPEESIQDNSHNNSLRNNAASSETQKIFAQSHFSNSQHIQQIQIKDDNQSFN